MPIPSSALAARAAAHGRSLEAEARAILCQALAAPPAGDLGRRIHDRFAALGGFEPELPPRR